MQVQNLKFGIITAGTTLALSVFCTNVEFAHAASISGLFNTGVDGTGTVLSPGSPDPHYTVVETGSPAVTVTSIPSSYVPNSSASLWIWQNANGQPTNVTRTFRTTFNLTGFIPSTASISGFWATDNKGLDILINGISTALTSPGFGSFTPFTISSGFTTGVNTLDFVVNDFGSISGFRVGGITGTADPILTPPPTPEPKAVPEPGTIIAILLAGLMVLRYGKRYSSTARP